MTFSLAPFQEKRCAASNVGLGLITYTALATGDSDAERMTAARELFTSCLESDMSSLILSSRLADYEVLAVAPDQTPQVADRMPG